MAKLATSYEQLRKMTVEELVKDYDLIAQQTRLGLSFYRNEIARRDGEEQTRQMIDMTRQIRTLTLWIAGLTVVNLLMVAYTLF